MGEQTTEQERPKLQDYKLVTSEIIEKTKSKIPSKKAVLITTIAGLTFIAGALGSSVESGIKYSATTPGSATFSERTTVTEISPRRPVEIIQHPDEVVNKQDTFTLKSDNVPPESKELTENIKKAGYRTIFSLKEGESYQRVVEIPPELQRILSRTIEPINNLLPLDKQITRFEVYPIIDITIIKPDLKAYPLANPSGVGVELRPDHEFPIQQIELAAFHEGIHVFLFDKEADWAEKVYGCCWNYLDEDRRQSIEERRSEMTKEGYSRDEIFDFLVFAINDGQVEQLRPLFNVLDESSYGVGSGGHPYDSTGELFVSTITVLHFFPKSFMLSVENLHPEDKKFILTVAKSAIDFLKENSTDKSKAESMFSPEVLEYLANN